MFEIMLGQTEPTKAKVQDMRIAAARGRTPLLTMAVTSLERLLSADFELILF